MRIAILTLAFNTNYGGIIQNYALQKCLRNQGYDVRTIRIAGKDVGLSLRDKIIKYPYRFLKKILGRKDGVILVEKKKKQDYIISCKYLSDFINQYILQTKALHTKEELQNEFKSGYDVVIVGSDQVWRPKYLYPSLETFFLDFVDDDIKRIAYAISFGTDEVEYNEEQIIRCRDLYKRFDAVSVREFGALNLLNNIYRWKCKQKPVWVLDPTMLLLKKDYENLIQKSNCNIDNGELFCYILDKSQEKKDIVNTLSSKLNYKPYKVERKSDDFWDDAENKIYPSLEQWLKGFQQAKYVFTDSFHGCVFSIIFNKPFIAYGNNTRGMSRFNSLFKMVGLENRLIHNISDITDELLNSVIKWDDINNVISKMRDISTGFLLKNIISNE